MAYGGSGQDCTFAQLNDRFEVIIGVTLNSATMFSLSGTTLEDDGSTAAINGDDNFLMLPSTSGFTVPQCKIDTTNPQFLREAIYFSSLLK
jgi:hypothetical protein